MWKFYESAQFLQSFGCLVRNSTETVHFYKFSTAEKKLGKITVS